MLMDVYAALDIRGVINAASSLTKLGGSTLPPRVVAAMGQASQSLVDMDELASRVGEELARLTRNEAATVTASAAAAIALGIMAFRTRGDERLITRLPRDPALPSEIIMYCAHRNPYDKAVSLAGARIRQIGDTKQTFDFELEAAIGPETAGILFVAGVDYERGALCLERTVEIASAHGVPVLVDAAAQLPPVENLWRYTKDLGAALAVFSGGKQLRGPQASGLVVGAEWAVTALRSNAAPRQRFGRAMKVGKEEMVGLLTAVELFLEEDHDSRFEQLTAICNTWVTKLAECPRVTAVVEGRNAGGASLPRVRITLNDSALDAREIEKELWEAQPRIAVLVLDAESLCLEPEQLTPAEAQLVSDRLLEVLGIKHGVRGPE